jgi:Kinesin motor domain
MGIGLDSINSQGEEESKGIVPRAIHAIFNHLDESRQNNPAYKSFVTVSFLELYNEELVDLLNPRPRSASGTHHGPSIREDGSGHIVWHNVSQEKANNPEDLMRYIRLMFVYSNEELCVAQRDQRI